MNSIYLSLGSNLGNKEENLNAALDLIEKRIGDIKSLSAFYYSEPVGFISDNIFVNCACEVSSKYNIHRAFSITQDIEKELGRSKKSISGKYSDRIIDIDLLLAGSQIIDSTNLTIPHPKMHERDFVLKPLCEIAPNVIHPILNKSILDIYNDWVNSKLIKE